MLDIVQVVRKFGTDGGMERYVWELSHALADLGFKVHVLCEQTTKTTHHKNIKVNYVSKVISRPRWLAMFRFSINVRHWVEKNTSNDWIIHSHERTPVHQVTTFHGPPFANIKSKPLWKRLSVRIRVWLYLEYRELCSNQVQFVLPNSDLILQDLKKFYPCVTEKLSFVAYPGVRDFDIKKRQLKNKKVIFFVGKEWKRKGLEFTIKIVEELRFKDRNIELWVAGPEKNEIEHLFKKWKKGFRLLGWCDPTEYFPMANLLLHPAISEPYGMAISEATSFSVPVVISNRCGIANQVTNDSGSVVDLGEDLSKWVDACLCQLNRKSSIVKVGKSWKELAREHIKIYQSIR